MDTHRHKHCLRFGAGHTGPRPRSPGDAQPRQPLTTPIGHEAIEEVIGRRIVGLLFAAPNARA